MILAGLLSGLALPAAEELAPLPIKLPIPPFGFGPVPVPQGDQIERPSDRPRPPFMAPKGSTNLALGKEVTSSDPAPFDGTHDMITDGDKGSTNYVELHRKTQWVQIDLGKPAKLYAILVWHRFDKELVCHDVIVQVAEDLGFTRNVRTIFNNDLDNSSGQGVGTDREYYESFEGRLIDAKGIKGRHVRLYSKGNTYRTLNAYTEVEVWGLPVE